MFGTSLSQRDHSRYRPTGYIGGRLIPRLLSLGHQVRVLVRDPQRIHGRPWARYVDVRAGSMLQQEAVTEACRGIDAAYYLVHSLATGRRFAEIDRRAADIFTAAAMDVPKVIYLGGLVPQAPQISPHLASRAEVGKILSKLPLTELRAGPIIGSGSASFEMIRYLVDRLPLMFAPKWITNPVQPIAVRDILAYLIGSLDHPPLGPVDVGTDPLTFRDMLLEYASIRGYRRRIIRVPILAPRLAAPWVGLVTPISNNLAVPLVQGIMHPVTADTARAREIFPGIRPIPYRQAVALALERIRAGVIETRWSGALGDTQDVQLVDWEGLIRETRTEYVPTSPEKVFKAFSSLGGERGWLVWEWAWRARGMLDKLIGGPGLRRGRRHPTELLTGEAIDFWRVEKIEPGRLLRLRAEMKVPGKAWLQWEAVPEGSGTLLVQNAVFEPKGIGGFLYWYGIYPLHGRIFSDMIHAVARLAIKGWN